MFLEAHCFRLLAALSILFPAATSAQEKIEYRLTWMVESSDEQKEAASYSKLSELAQTRLLPTQLLVADSDITLPGGKILAKEGTQFAALRSDLPMACNVHKQNDETLAGKKHLCLVDKDSDGTFDSHFVKGRDSHYWYVLAGSVRPSKLKDIQPATLSSAPAEDLNDAPILSVNFGRFLDAGNLFQGGLQGQIQSETAVSFFYEVGTAKRMNLMSRNCVDEPIEPYGCAPAVFPIAMVLLGLDAVVHERDGEDAIISVASGFEPAEVFMTTKMSGYYTLSELFLYEGD